MEELTAATGWTKTTVDTYFSKHWSEVVERLPNHQFRILPKFQRLSRERFLGISTQKRKLFASYNRTKYSEIVTYEFLLPLTREDQLRTTLDALFYKDTIQRRINEITLAEIEKWILRNEGESDSDYTDRVCAIIGSKFGGYSISHVSGRYLAANLADRVEAARMLVDEERYIIDETTASVRFIIPIASTRTSQKDGFAGVPPAALELDSSVAEEIALVHWLFFTLFVEAVVLIVAGEDEIWLVEETGQTRNLYSWEREQLYESDNNGHSANQPVSE